MRIFENLIIAILFVLSLSLLSTVSAQTNVALRKPATQSSFYNPDFNKPMQVVDGNRNGQNGPSSITHTQNGSAEWWQVDLQGLFSISKIDVYNRTDCCSDRIVGSTVQILKGTTVVWSGTIPNQGSTVAAANMLISLAVPSVVGDHVKISNKPGQYLHMAEVEVFGVVPPPVAVVAPAPVQTNVALRKPATQSSFYNPDFNKSMQVVDGNRNGQNGPSSIIITKNGSAEWWQVDLQGLFSISKIDVYNRTDCCSDAIVGSTVQILKGATVVWSGTIPNKGSTVAAANMLISLPVPSVVGDHVKILNKPGQNLQLAEVEVFGVVAAPVAVVSPPPPPNNPITSNNTTPTPTPQVRSQDSFCWKDSYGRGVGTIPTSCEGGKEYQAGLCYNKCPAGMNPVGPVCWSGCPAGYIDMGAICHIDKPLTRNDCERHWYTFGFCVNGTCPSGYTNAGLFCALTAFPTPAGFSGTYLDPMKNTYARGAGTIPTGCSGKEYDAGLCYENCRAGYSGVGPVCWGSNPPGWTGCGMGSAKDSAACAAAVIGQVASVGQLALAIVPLAGKGAQSAQTAAQGPGYLADLKQKYEQLKSAYQANKNAIDALSKVNQARGIGQTTINLGTSDTVTPEDIARLAAQIAAATAGAADPTGLTGAVAGAVAAYTYPVCSALIR